MISKEDFLTLYKKYIEGNCTAGELRLLDEYQDELNLNDAKWPHHNRDIHDVRNRILQRINHNGNITHTHHGRRFAWLKVAAILTLTLAAGLFFIKRKNLATGPELTMANRRGNTISPGGNKAFLIMANGKRIVLNDIKQGKVVVQAGIQISKSKTGMLTYNFKADPGSKTNTAIDAYNTIVTPRGGQYQVVLADGTRVWLNAASSLHFPVSFSGNKRNVVLTGEAYFEVAKNKEKPFTVEANGTSVQVLGTHFNVNAYADNEAVKTTLLEGSVKLEKGQETAMLKPGEQGTILNNQTGITVKTTVDADEVMAWKNGYFIFHDENITNIMKQVARWYDVDIVYTDAVVKDNEFGGTMSKYKNITELLDNMELTHAIHYKLEGRRVTIMR